MSDSVWSQSEECDESEDAVNDGISLGLCLVNFDIDDNVLQGAPESDRGWEVNLLPEGHRCEHTAGVGEREEHAFVQTGAIRPRMMTADLDNKRCLLLAARQLLTVQTMQNLKQAWVNDGLQLSWRIASFIQASYQKVFLLWPKPCRVSLTKQKCLS